MSNDVTARFSRDTARHQMTVLHDDGLYRHLKCAIPGTGYYRFDLVTWPHNLMLHGDGISFAFSLYPTVDLFDLFRRTAWPGEINPGYWSEKVTAGRSDIENYSEALLKQEIEDRVQYWEECDLNRRIVKRAGVKSVSDLTEDMRKANAMAVEAGHQAFAKNLRAAVDEHFFGELADYNVEYEEDAKAALTAFSYGEGYEFSDWYEWRLRDHSWQFLWACHAIVWGIARWDKAGRDGLRGLATQAGGAR